MIKRNPYRSIIKDQFQVGCSFINRKPQINYPYFGKLTIEINRSLASLEGLKNLTSVRGKLTIEINRSLTSLEGLKSLTYVGGDFEVAENHGLCTSAAEALRGQLLGAGGIGGDVDISDNKNC
jgi:hypothetical protein